tara:strand:- start:59 stop:562 length:504 start_codon:yes stop_codon:yes gene_type:complete
MRIAISIWVLLFISNFSYSQNITGNLSFQKKGIYKPAHIKTTSDSYLCDSTEMFSIDKNFIGDTLEIRTSLFSSIKIKIFNFPTQSGDVIIRNIPIFSIQEEPIPVISFISKKHGIAYFKKRQEKIEAHIKLLEQEVNAYKFDFNTKVYKLRFEKHNHKITIYLDLK